jgi:hypothetical protein
MRVRVLKLGSGTKEVDVAHGASVRSAVEAAHFSLEGSLSVNGIDSNADATLRDNDLITIVPRVEGGHS